MYSLVLAMLPLAGILACTAGPPPPAILDVPGRADATPWVAASGPYAAVVWGATADGKADVFVSVSRDGGSTFGPPVQVNQVVGEARLGGEFPPRVAFGPQGTRALSQTARLIQSHHARS